MTKELVVSATRRETRVAVIEDEQVVEVYFQRENEYSLAGSIHKGRVTRVLPGMQSRNTTRSSPAWKTRS
jgi:Ribonuclease G/E